MSDLELVLEALNDDRPITGMDTSICSVPGAAFAEIEGEKTIVMRPFLDWLQRVSRAQAAAIGEELHHAEWVMTNSPSTVQARGAMHDCDECRAGVRRALQMLREQPDRMLLVGSLYWAGEA